MGNRFGRSTNKKAPRAPVGILVVHADSGRISRFLPSSSPASLHAGEVMLEHPNHYLCCLSNLQIGRQMSPVPADRCLEPAHAYVLLPMRKLRSRVSQEDLAFFLASLNLTTAASTATAQEDDNFDQSPINEGKSKPRKQSGSRISPLMSSSALPPPPLDNLTQYEVGENVHLQGCPDTATNLRQTLPLLRSRSVGLGVDLAATEEDSEDDLLGQVMRMKKALTWMPKLEPIEESE